MTPTPTEGTWKVSPITGDDKSRAVKRSLASVVNKVRITEGQRRTIVGNKRKSR